MAFQIVISVSDQGAVNVAGPGEVLGNKVLAYGVLELAKDAIRNVQAEVPRIVPAAFVPPPPANGPVRLVK